MPTSGGEKNSRGFNRHSCFTNHEDESLEHSHLFPIENQRTERKLKEIGKDCLHHRRNTRSGGYLSSGEPSPTSGVSPDRNGRKTTRCLIQIALRHHSRLLQMRLSSRSRYRERSAGSPGIASPSEASCSSRSS